MRKNFRPTGTAPSLARQAVVAVASDVPSSELGTAQLLTSELVMNSVVHGTSLASDRIGLVVEVERETLRVEVSERSSGTPEKRAPTTDGGYGLMLVDELASRWGTYREDQGNVTWFEVDLPAAGTR